MTMITRVLPISFQNTFNVLHIQLSHSHSHSHPGPEGFKDKAVRERSRHTLPWLLLCPLAGVLRGNGTRDE